MVKALQTKQKKTLWQGTRLPSSGCLQTVLTFVGYRDEVEPLCNLLNSSGKTFYNSYIRQSPFFRDNLLNRFPKTRYGSVRFRSIDNVDCSLISDLYVSQGKENKIKESEKLNIGLVEWLEANTRETDRVIHV